MAPMLLNLSQYRSNEHVQLNSVTSFRRDGMNPPTWAVDHAAQIDSTLVDPNQIRCRQLLHRPVLGRR